MLRMHLECSTYWPTNHPASFYNVITINLHNKGYISILWTENLSKKSADNFTDY